MFWERNYIHVISYRAPTADRDVNGDTVGGTIVNNVRCRVEARRDRVRNADNNEVVSSHRIHVSVAIPLGSAIWIPHLDDTIGDENDARYPITVATSEQLKGGGGRLTSVYL